MITVLICFWLDQGNWLVNNILKALIVSIFGYSNYWLDEGLRLPIAPFTRNATILVLSFRTNIPLQDIMVHKWKYTSVT